MSLLQRTKKDPPQHATSYLNALHYTKLTPDTVTTVWREKNKTRFTLNVPLGYQYPALGSNELTSYVSELNLHPSHYKNHSPHTLITGQAECGKSQLLETIGIGLTLQHSPRQIEIYPINLTPSDTFTHLKYAPHVKNPIDLNNMDKLFELYAFLERENRNRTNFLTYEKSRTKHRTYNMETHYSCSYQKGTTPDIPYLVVLIDMGGEMGFLSPKYVEKVGHILSLTCGDGDYVGISVVLVAETHTTRNFDPTVIGTSLVMRSATRTVREGDIPVSHILHGRFDASIVTSFEAGDFLTQTHPGGTNVLARKGRSFWLCTEKLGIDSFLETYQQVMNKLSEDF